MDALGSYSRLAQQEIRRMRKDDNIQKWAGTSAMLAALDLCSAPHKTAR
jgi:hypothetical protein